MGELRVKGPARTPTPTPTALDALSGALEDGTVWDGGTPDDVLTIGDDGLPAWEPIVSIDGGSP